MKLFCVTYGPDTLPPLLLIHGAPGSWFDVRNTLDDTLLQKHFQLIAVDRPGYGNSRKRINGRTSDIPSLDRQAHQISHALSLNRSGKPAIVLGRSYGGPIAARLAMLYADKIRHLFMVAPPLDPAKEKFFWFSPLGRLPLLQLFLPDDFNTATAEKYAHTTELQKLQPFWPEVQVPVTVIQGGNDWIVDPANLAYVRQRLSFHREARFVYLPEAGHAITETHPELVRKLILDTTPTGQPMPGTIASNK